MYQFGMTSEEFSEQTSFFTVYPVLLVALAQNIAGLYISERIDKIGKIKLVFTLNALSILTTPLIGLSPNYYVLLVTIFLNSIFQSSDISLSSAN